MDKINIYLAFNEFFYTGNWEYLAPIRPVDSSKEKEISRYRYTRSEKGSGLYYRVTTNPDAVDGWAVVLTMRVPKNFLIVWLSKILLNIIKYFHWRKCNKTRVKYYIYYNLMDDSYELSDKFNAAAGTMLFTFEHHNWERAKLVYEWKMAEHWDKQLSRENN
jgi:hypothetical protein